MSNSSTFKTIARVAIIATTCLALTAPSFAAFTADGELLPEVSEVKVEVKRGNYSKAIRMLTTILKDDSRNADALNLMGYSQRKSGNKARGEAFYLQALRFFEMDLEGIMSGVEILGVIAVTIMVTSYALEKRNPIFIAIFAVGCALAALYAYLIASYPFLIAEGIWAVIAVRRWLQARSALTR